MELSTGVRTPRRILDYEIDWVWWQATLKECGVDDEMQASASNPHYFE